jgi:two-component system, cell cycle sensor histidine kinase and response regulator CckA
MTNQSSGQSTKAPSGPPGNGREGSPSNPGEDNECRPGEGGHGCKQYRRLAGVLEAMNVGTWEWDVPGGKMIFNDRWWEIAGLDSRESECGVHIWWRLIHPRDRRVAKEVLRAHFSQEAASMEAELRLRRGGGQWVWVKVRGKALAWSDDGNPLTVFGSMTDISARKRAEEGLRESQHRYDQLAEQSRTFAWEVNREGLYTFVSPVVFSVLGYRPEELVGRKYFYDLCPSDERDAIKAFGFETIRRGGSLSGFENRVVDKGGRVLWVMSSGRSMFDTDGEIVGFRGADTDITSRKEAEERRQLLATALDAAANTLVITNRNGTIEWANRAFCEISGYTLEEALGRTPGELLKSGVHDDAFYRRMWTTILAGRVWSGEVVNRRKDGSLYPEALTITPVKNEEGEIHHFVAIKRDLTEEKARERQVFRNQRLESIGTLAGGIAHDLNNALTPILISVDLLRSGIEDPTNQRFLDNIETSATRSAGMVKQVLNFAQGVGGERAVLNVRHLVRDIANLISDTFPKNIQLNIDSPKDAWPVRGDVTQLHQVLLNLCLNARDAMPEGGVLSVTLCNQPAVSEEDNGEPLPTYNGDFLKLVVADTGFGMSAEVQERIFDPFYTTKDVDRGTGLGLSTVHSIVKGHGGFVQVESAPGKGAVFEVYLPRHQENQANGSQSQARLMPATGRDEELLVVDDDELVLSTLCSLLTSSGYRVTEAHNGVEALTIFTRRSSEFAAVLIDLAMPRMDGISAIEVMREVRPSVRIIATSGHPPTGENRVAVNRFISKPYTQIEVLTAVREVLDEVDSCHR